MVKFWSFIIVLLPLYMRVTEAADPRVARDLFFVFCVFSSVILFGFKRQPDIYHRVLFFSVGVMAFFNQYDQYSFTVIFEWLAISAAMILALQVMSNFEQDDDLKLLPPLRIACLIQCAWITMHYFGVDTHTEIFNLIGMKTQRLTSQFKPFPIDYKMTLDGSLGNSSISGSLVALSSLAFLQGRWALFLVIPGITLAVLGGLGNLLAFIVPVAYFYMRRHLSIKNSLTILWSVGMMLIFSVYVFGTKYGSFFSDNERFLVWQKTIEMLGDNYLLGKGVGYFYDFFPSALMSVNGQYFRQAHNEFLQGYFTFGIIGVFIMICLLSPYIAACIREKADTNILFLITMSFFIISMVSLPFHISGLALIFILSYGYLNRSQIDGIFSNKS